MRESIASAEFQLVMEQEKNAQKGQAEAAKSGWNEKRSVVVFVILPLVLTILFPLGGIFYLCGRFSPYAVSLFYVCMLYPVVGLFVGFCLFRGATKLRRVWRTQTRKKNLLAVGQTVIPLLFFVAVFGSCLISVRGMMVSDKPFMYGFRERIRHNADLDAIRGWLGSLSTEDYLVDEYYNRISREKWPGPVKILKPEKVFLSADENSHPKVRLDWGGGVIGHWGAEIGMPDMKTPASDFSNYGEYRLPLKPGIYVWRKLE